MTTDEAQRRQAIAFVAAASAREWPKKTTEAWATALRPWPGDLVQEACEAAVSAWEGTLIMPVGAVVERVRALQRARGKQRERDDGWPEVTGCAQDAACRGGWMREEPPGHTYCPAHNVSWRARRFQVLDGGAA